MTPLRRFPPRAFLVLALALCAWVAPVSPLNITDLRCEYRENPEGLDARAPRFSWVLRGNGRGRAQIAYQIQVSSSAAFLARSNGDLWDTGRVPSDETVQIVYAGKPLSSRAVAFWRVRVWDENGRPTAWSKPGFWSMGLLDARDWQARWIGGSRDPDEAKPDGRRSPRNGFHSGIASDAAENKWVAINLGGLKSIDAVRLFPARPFNWLSDTPGFLFPLRFRIEAARSPDFSDAQTVADQTQSDVAPPGTNALTCRFASVEARYVRLIVTRLRRRDENHYGAALAELQVLGGGENLARGAPVTASDSIEEGGWSKEYLVDGLLISDLPRGAFAPAPAAMLRKTFVIDAPVRRATVYVTALGLYELRCNGRRVGDHLLAPEWTDYRKRIQYQTFDVTGLLRPGRNALGAMLAEGWYAGPLMLYGPGAYGSRPKFLLQLEIERTDGRMEYVATDSSWRRSPDGPIRSAGLYNGETYDARRETPGWDRAGFDDAAWLSAPERGPEPGRLVWQPNEPIRVIQELKPVRLTQPKPGLYLFDLGQNMAGWCRLKLRGTAGRPVTLRYAEVLDDTGALYTANLRHAAQTDTYIPKNGAAAVFEPRFTYHGFRYVEVAGLARPPAPDALTGRVFCSSAPEAGRFASSSPLINQLMGNISWTERANLMGVPTDCPQRDERFGWMGDIQVFAQTAIFNLNLAAFLGKWVRDIRDDQSADGRFPDFAPHPGDPDKQNSGAPAWADAGVIIPWAMYENYADKRALAEQFESATRWVNFIQERNPDLIWSIARGGDYNDWLNGDTLIHPGWPRTGGAVPPDVLATAFFAHSAEITAKMAAVLGRGEEARRFEELFSRIKAAFNARFVRPDGLVTGDTQAGYALALHFGLLPEALRPAALRHLLDALRRYNGHLSTGIQTTPRLMLELSRGNQHKEAWRLVNLRDFPSWGMMIDNGATTVWERWDGYVKGRGFQNPEMNSFNHWALGAVGEWVWRELAGFNPDETAPGYKHFFIHPRPAPGLNWVRSEYRSIRGAITSNWRVGHGFLTLEVIIPPNTTATVFVPASDPRSVRERGRSAQTANGVEFLGASEEAAVFRLKSGAYSFTAPFPTP
jgi:alpha-L-rhamnosidase